jgi:hypothetical protein
MSELVSEKVAKGEKEKEGKRGLGCQKASNFSLSLTFIPICD